SPYQPGSYNNPPPARSRKLLLHKHEIRKLIGATAQQGLTLIALELYFKDGLAKEAIALGRAKKLHDKREDLRRRAAERELARAACDLCVRIDVNAMPPGRRGERVSGVETYFLSDAKTEDQERVAKMENEALRFETETPAGAPGPLGYILRDLQLNEYLRV